MTVICGTDSILHNISHIQTECEEYSTKYCQSGRIFFKFSMNATNIPHETVSPAEQCYGSE
jgi:hypothetical protein